MGLSRSARAEGKKNDPPPKRLRSQEKPRYGLDIRAARAGPRPTTAKKTRMRGRRCQAGLSWTLYR